MPHKHFPLIVVRPRFYTRLICIAHSMRPPAASHSHSVLSVTCKRERVPFHFICRRRRRRRLCHRTYENLSNAYTASPQSISPATTIRTGPVTQTTEVYHRNIANPRDLFTSKLRVSGTSEKNAIFILPHEDVKNDEKLLISFDGGGGEGNSTTIVCTIDACVNYKCRMPKATIGTKARSEEQIK